VDEMKEQLFFELIETVNAEIRESVFNCQSPFFTTTTSAFENFKPPSRSPEVKSHLTRSPKKEEEKGGSGKYRLKNF